MSKERGGVAFLLGSGISVDAEMPRVGQISEQVWSGSGAWRHTDATYYLGGSENQLASNEAVLAAAIDLATRLRDLAADYYAEYAPGQDPNYEDVAYLARQVEDALSGEYENAALAPLLTDLREQLGLGGEGLQERARECRFYIEDTVWRLLDKPPARLEHLDVIADACADLGRADLFNLNHDTVLEAALREKRIDVSDGFGKRDGDVRYWGDRFDRPIQHLKLHGCINWFRREHPDPIPRWVVAQSLTNDPDHERSASGALLGLPVDGRPQILVGTFDKPLAYDSSIFADQHLRFHNGLRNTSRLIVIGYGFRDKGINRRVWGWLRASGDRRMVVVHRDPESLREGARPMIRGQWAELVAAGRLATVNKPVANATWGEVAAAACASG